MSILSLFPTRALVPISPTCRHLHSLVLRVLHQRLQIAAGLGDYKLYLECHHPSARLTAPGFFCIPLGTEGLTDLLADIDGHAQSVGQLRRAGSLLSRFRPQRQEPDVRQYRHPAGDIPGSRTYQAPAASGRAEASLAADQVVKSIVTVDAQDLFTQLTTGAYLGKRDPRRGVLLSTEDVCDGTIRVWRDWLSKQCESKKWTDGDTVVIQHEPADPGTSSGVPGLSPASSHDRLRKDSSILWVNTRDESVGLKFRVKERKLRRTNPILYTSDLEVAVSYEVEIEGKSLNSVRLSSADTPAQRS